MLGKMSCFVRSVIEVNKEISFFTLNPIMEVIKKTYFKPVLGALTLLGTIPAGFFLIT